MHHQVIRSASGSIANFAPRWVARADPGPGTSMSPKKDPQEAGTRGPADAGAVANGGGGAGAAAAKAKAKASSRAGAGDLPRGRNGMVDLLAATASRRRSDGPAHTSMPGAPLGHPGAGASASSAGGPEGPN